MENLLQLTDSWAQLRSPGFLETVKDVIEQSAADEMSIVSISHVRTAHYVACRVSTEQSSWLVRVGVVEPSDSRLIDNTGYLKTSTFVPSGQHREYLLSKELHSSGVNVTVPGHYFSTPDLYGNLNLDVLWLPFLEDSGDPMTASQWGHALRSFHSMSPEEQLPVFTNRAKTFARLESMADREAAERFAREYDSALERLFDVATSWSPVHGDAHCGNVLISFGSPVLFDFDTVCWAPSVWDLTHLLSRVGTENNTGYTTHELLSEFDFTDEEVEAAVNLRKIATQIARAVR